MAKEELLEFAGQVTECLPDTRFVVLLDNGHTVIGYPSGKMRKNHIRIVTGDRVKIEVTPYDLTRGRITFRQKEDHLAANSEGKPASSSPSS